MSAGLSRRLHARFSGRQGSTACFTAPKRATTTLFVVSGLGIAFGTPDTVEAAHIKSVGDAIVLKTDGLRRIVDNPKNVFAMDIDDKPPTETTGSSLKASTAVARRILLDTNSAILRRALKID